MRFLWQDTLRKQVHGLDGGTVRIAPAVLAFVVVVGLADVAGGRFDHVMAGIAGRVAASLLASPAWVDNGALTIEAPRMAVVVTDACSGLGFVSLLAGLLAWTWGAKRGVLPVVAVGLAGVAAALLISVPVNAGRIVLAYYARVLMGPALPEDLLSGLHLVCGLVVFLPILILASSLPPRRPSHASA